ncbi:MAG: hypothetical protein E6J26_01415 [Chloroflexi bacterium]|nr:MAG: hypothetical protein E6J26_01415 [Chloroflexota bacterium]
MASGLLPSIWQRTTAMPVAIARRDWAYKVPGARDLRLDWLRGYATMAMVVDHLGSSSYLHVITGGNNFFVSAAEGFVFISGMIVGVVYGDTARKEGLNSAARKALLRAWTLYKLTVVLTIAFVALVLRENLPWSSWLDPTDPTQFLLGVITLRRTFVFVDIPLMYTFLMLLAPAGLLLLRAGRTWLLLVCSWAIWFGYQLSPIQQAIPTVVEGNWIFKLPAWQLLFFNAMALGYGRHDLARRLQALRPTTRYLYFAGVASLLALLILLFVQQEQILAYVLPEEQSKALVSALFDKSSLAPGRLFAALVVFQFSYMAVTYFWAPLSRLGWLVPMGQNSLYAYTMHVAFLVMFYALIPYLAFYSAFEITVNTVGQLLALAAIYVMIQKKFLFNIVPR